MGGGQLRQQDAHDPAEGPAGQGDEDAGAECHKPGVLLQVRQVRGRALLPAGGHDGRAREHAQRDPSGQRQLGRDEHGHCERPSPQGRQLPMYVILYVVYSYYIRSML